MATVTHYIAIMKWFFLLNRAASTLKFKKVSQTIYKKNIRLMPTY